MDENEQIRRDLLEQLDNRGMNQRFYTSLVDDYISLWETKEMLFKDIKERGVMTEWNNGGGQTGVKKNDCVPEVNRISASMLKILSELGLRGSSIKEVEPDAEM